MKFHILFSLTVFLAVNTFAKQFKQEISEGVKYLALKKYDEAENKFNQILRHNPTYPLANYNLGLTKYRKEDYKAAIQSFDKVIASKSFYSSAAHYYKAISQLNIDQPKEALKTAKSYDRPGFMSDSITNLVTSLQAGSDEFLSNARSAAADGNYELCLLEMDESVFSDTRTGRDLTNQCFTQIKGTNQAAKGRRASA